MSEDLRAWLRAAVSPRVAADVVVVTGLWLLLAGSVHLQELAAALLVGLVAGGIGLVVRAEVGHRPAAVRRHAVAMGRMYLGALIDCWTLARVLLRHPVGRVPAGQLRWVPFEAGDERRGDVGRRVLATVGTSLQPNTYVVGFDHERDLVLVHELVEDGRPAIDEALGRRR